jgi:beta-1,4-mannosyl-glycoprotein beta-1,4-N-acetylglucosaminyltransferase
MIYDCFSFFNELDLLEIRLNILDPYVDKFVLVEATRTFQKNPKPLFYELNKERFAKFHSKIEHIIVDQYPNFFSKFRVPKPWDYDNHQKNQVKKALTSCKPNDIIIFSDLDEIPNPHKILEYKDKEGFFSFEQIHCYYYFNCIEYESENSSKYKFWNGSTMTKFKNFKNIKHLRFHIDLHKFPQTQVIKNGGWHLAYLGGIEKIIYKIESYAHDEHNLIDTKKHKEIEQKVLSGKGLYGNELFCRYTDDYSFLPQFILENRYLYQKHFKTLS